VRIRLVLLMNLLVAVPGSTSTDPAGDPALDSLGGTPRQIVARTGERTVQAGTARIAMAMDTSGGMFPSSSNGEGVIDLREKAGEVRQSWAALASAVPLNDMTFTVIFTNGDVYVGRLDAHRMLGAPGGTVAGMKPWLRMTGAGPVAFGRYVGLDLSQPYLGLEQLHHAVSVTEVGRDRVRDVAVRHFHAEIGVERHIAEMSVEHHIAFSSPRDSAKYRKALADHRKALFDAYHRAGISSLPVDVWVDGQGRVRKLQSRLDIPELSVIPPVPGPAQRVESEATMLAWTVEFYDFGVPVHVEIPPADQVTDF
jgi:hypothetical protein